MISTTIAALGGWPKPSMVEFLLGLTGAERPRVAFVPTAAGDADWTIESFEEACGERSEPSHLRLFETPADDPRRVLDADLVYVQGGNTASMLAVWRIHGLDRILREAWEAGVVLAGHSAGAICWLEAGVTDSFSAELDALGLPRLPPRLLLPPLRRGGAAPACLPPARRTRASGRSRGGRRLRPPVPRHRARRGGRGQQRRAGLPRRAARRRGRRDSARGAAAPL